MLIGRLTADPEKQKVNDTSVTKFTVATNRSYKNQKGEKVEKAEFHKCEAWGKTWEIIEKYLGKGRRIYVEGRLKTDQWEDDNGNNRYTTKINVRNFRFLDSKKDWNSKKKTKENVESVEDDLPF